MRQIVLLVCLVALSAVAYAWPRFANAAVDPFLYTAGWLPYMIMVTMLAIGWMLPVEEVRRVAGAWPKVIGGTTVQFLSMPLLAWSLGKLFGLEGDTMLGIVMVGCVPGAMASNVLTLMARGNVSYSVSLTTMATLLSPLVVPLGLWLAVDREVGFGSFAQVIAASWKLCWMVVIPVVVGFMIGRRLPGWETTVRRAGTLIANAVILWVIAVVVAKNRDLLGEIPRELLMALASVNVLGYLAGASGARLMRLPTAMRRALTLEVGMQNAGLGATLALELFPDRPAAAIPAAAYTFGCMLTGSLLAAWWSWRTGEEVDNVDEIM
jgi:BASS family bile acid:Na+ symporter